MSDAFQPWLNRMVQRAPEALKARARRVREALAFREGPLISEPTGSIDPRSAERVFVAVVGRSFNQNRPDAMMTCRMGYCRAFEAMGIPYLIADWRRLPELLPSLPNPFCFVVGQDVAEMGEESLAVLRHVPVAVWVSPWFEDERAFFAAHGLNEATWVWRAEHRRRIVDLRPRFVFTATVESGMHFFSGWMRAGLRPVSLPLACDTTLYAPPPAGHRRFEGVDLAFVGGYWESKGKQLDRYLRPFEDRLVIYGYNRWPYTGYRGRLPREQEPALYRQALVCPVINEPTVALLHGQINERVFKVLGSGGTAVTDAVPAYRALFSVDELPVSQDEREFQDLVNALLADGDLRRRYTEKGRAAVLGRHTYTHRVRQVLGEFFSDPVIASEQTGPLQR